MIIVRLGEMQDDLRENNVPETSKHVEATYQVVLDVEMTESEEIRWNTLIHNVRGIRSFVTALPHDSDIIPVSRNCDQQIKFYNMQSYKMILMTANIFRCTLI
jgi:hypothetical protein